MYTDSKCAKIFRPWDGESAQDATITTTTNDIDNITTPPKTSPLVADAKPCDKKDKPAASHKKSFRRVPPKAGRHECLSVPDYPGLQDICSSPACLQNPLELSAADHLFLESMTSGYALEEYARILTQEHQAKLISARKQRPKKYKCPHCEVGFSNNGQLKGHIRIHTGERPFKCDEKDCGKTFTRNEELTRHKRIHSGLRPFPCTHCGKRFGRKDHLKKHSRTHFQPRGVLAVPVMLPFDAWATPTPNYPYVPMFTY